MRPLLLAALALTGGCATAPADPGRDEAPRAGVAAGPARLRAVVAANCGPGDAGRLLSLLGGGEAEVAGPRGGEAAVEGLAAVILGPSSRRLRLLLERASPEDEPLARVLGALLEEPEFRRTGGTVVVRWWASARARLPGGGPEGRLDAWLGPDEEEEFLEEVVACREAPPGDDSWHLGVASRPDLPPGPRIVAVQSIGSVAALESLLGVRDPWVLAEVLRCMASPMDVGLPVETWRRAAARGAAESLRVRSMEFDRAFLGEFLPRTGPPEGPPEGLRDALLARLEQLSGSEPPEEETAQIVSWLMDAWIPGAGTADWVRLEPLLAGGASSPFQVALLWSLPRAALPLERAVRTLAESPGRPAVRAAAVRWLESGCADR